MLIVFLRNFWFQNLFQHQKLVCCVAAVQHNCQTIKKSVESVENQIFVEVPIFDLVILLEIGRTLHLVCLLTMRVKQKKNQILHLEAGFEILESLLSFLDLVHCLFNLWWKWGQQYYFHLNCEDGGGINVSASLVDQQITDLLHAETK